MVGHDKPLRHLEYPVAIVQTDSFRDWLDTLKDRSARARINDRLKRLAYGNAGDSKSVGDGVQELRLHFGPGYRVYIHVAGWCSGHSSPRRRQEFSIARHREGQEAGEGS